MEDPLNIMKVLKNIIIGFLILLLVIYLAVFVFVKIWAKDLLSQKFSQAVGKEVGIGALSFALPYSIIISDLSIKDLLFVKKVTLEPSIIGLLSGQRGLNKLWLIKPVVSLVRIENTRFNVNEIVDYIKSKPAGANTGKRANFFVKEAIIEEGRISLDDKITGLSFSVMPLELSVITSLKDFRTKIDLEALVLSDTKQALGNIAANGWLNLLRKDMEAKFYFNDADIAYFAPYFKSFAKKIKSGKLFFTSDMVSRDNDLNITCHLETQNLKFSDEESLVSDSQSKKLALFGNISGIIFDTLIGPAGGGIFDFSIRTKFDRPRLEGLQLQGNIFQQPITNIFTQSPKQGIETIKKIGKDFEAIGKEFKDQFKDIGDMFKVKEEESQGQQTETQASETQESAPISATAQ